MPKYTPLLLLVACLLSAQAPTALTNDTIVKLVQAGVPSETIIRTIAAAERVEFTFLPGDLNLMNRAGVPDDVFKAMAAKSNGRPVPTQALPLQALPPKQPTAERSAALSSDPVPRVATAADTPNSQNNVEPTNGLTSQAPFKFAREQRVYVVAVEAISRDLNMTKADLQVERRAKDELMNAKLFQVSNTLRDADFVFFVLIDSTGQSLDEIALVTLPSDYQRLGNSLDALRNVALWQSDNHFKPGRHAALAAATIGASAFFDRPSVVKGLVKKLHKDTLGK